MKKWKKNLIKTRKVYLIGTKKPCGNNDLCKFAQLLIAKNKMVRTETAI